MCLPKWAFEDPDQSPENVRTPSIRGVLRGVFEAGFFQRQCATERTAPTHSPGLEHTHIRVPKTGCNTLHEPDCTLSHLPVPG